MKRTIWHQKRSLEMNNSKQGSMWCQDWSVMMNSKDCWDYSIVSLEERSQRFSRKLELHKWKWSVVMTHVKQFSYSCSKITRCLNNGFLRYAKVSLTIHTWCQKVSPDSYAIRKLSNYKERLQTQSACFKQPAHRLGSIFSVFRESMVTIMIVSS